MESFDYVVIGAGVIGLAIAAGLAGRRDGGLILVLERHSSFGRETSSRNSEVIHSGIYYPAGSLKARLCTRGNRLLYDFCERNGVPCRRLGKLIVARNDQEIPVLEDLMKKGRENGVNDLIMLDRRQVRTLEPHVNASAAILSPSTGIIDSHKLMARLETLAEQGDAMIAYGHEVTGILPGHDGYDIIYRDPSNGEDRLKTRCIINAAGLGSARIASLMGIDIDREGYRLYPCKGEYFSVDSSKSNMVTHLVYPPPMKNLEGLGIHVTKSLDGRIRLGPNAFYVDHEDYDVDSSHGGVFYEAAKAYLPFLEECDIKPDMAGIRPKLQGPDDPVKDFLIRDETDRGLPGVINLVGMESPGLTSCLAIAEYVCDMLEAYELPRCS